MAIPAVIAAAAENYRFNSRFVKQTVSDLSPDEWLKRPGDNTNHIAWIVGHMAMSRGVVLRFLGTTWTRPELEMFGRGKKLMADSAYPSRESLLDAWSESGHVMATAFENISEDLLVQPAPAGPPSLDGKVSGIVNFMAIHETYHLGQASYLRSWMGHKGLMG